MPLLTALSGFLQPLTHGLLVAIMRIDNTVQIDDVFNKVAIGLY